MKIINYTITLIISCTVYACNIYSFNGASISSNVKTVSVQYFPNNASTIQPALSQNFSEKLKDYFLEQTNLKLIDNNADLNFSGEIKKYEIKPIAIGSDEIARKNRLTIDVQVIFSNKYDSKANFDQKFSRYKDYESSLNLSDIEEGLIEEITSELAEDIFNKSVVNW